MVKAKIPKIVPAGDLSAETQKAAREMIAQALREQAEVLNLTLHDLTYDGRPIGTWEISIRKVED